MRILWAWVVEILKSPNRDRSRELRTARRRVKRNSIVINNPARRSRLDRELSRASCKANTIYHPFKRERRGSKDRCSRKWVLEERWKCSVETEVRETHKTRFKLKSRYFSLSTHVYTFFKNWIFVRTISCGKSKLAADFVYHCFLVCDIREYVELNRYYGIRLLNLRINTILK